MNKKLIAHLSIGLLVGLLLLFLYLSVGLCYDGGPHHFYCSDTFEMGLPILALAIPLIVSYMTYKKRA